MIYFTKITTRRTFSKYPTVATFQSLIDNIKPATTSAREAYDCTYQAKCASGMVQITPNIIKDGVAANWTFSVGRYIIPFDFNTYSGKPKTHWSYGQAPNLFRAAKKALKTLFKTRESSMRKLLDRLAEEQIMLEMTKLG